MANQREVESFLKFFHEKTKIFTIIYRDDRGKNQKTLEILELNPLQRKEIIKSLTFQDYVEGPLTDTLNKLGDMWVFGKSVKNKDIYIKITLGNPGCPTICISFHIAEHPMKYPFKN